MDEITGSSYYAEVIWRREISDDLEQARRSFPGYPDKEALKRLIHARLRETDGASAAGGRFLVTAVEEEGGEMERKWNNAARMEEYIGSDPDLTDRIRHVLEESRSDEEILEAIKQIMGVRG